MIPFELLYIWAVALLVITGLVYLWVRLRAYRRQQNQPDATVENHDWFARLVHFVAGKTAAWKTDVNTEAEPAALRLPVTAALVAAILLVWMGQSVYQDAPPQQQRWIWGLMILGGIIFLLAGQTAVRQQAPRWLIWLGSAPGRFFGVDAGRLVCLFFAPLFAWMASLAAGDSIVARHPGVAAFAWMTAIGLAVTGSLQTRPEARPATNRYELLFTAVLFAVAFALRGTATAVMPPTFSGDEGSAGLTAVLFRDGQASNLFATGWFSFPSLYFALQSVGLHIWGQTIEALRIPSALAGAATVVALYWLGRSLFDRRVAAIAAVYLTVSHYHIHISRIGLNNIWDGLFGVLALLGFWHGWKTGRRSAYVLCGVALGLGLYFYVSIRALPLLFLLWSALALWRERAQFRQRLPGMVLAAFVAVVIALPLGLYFLERPEEFNAPLNRVTILGERLQQEVQFRGQPASQILLEQLRNAVLGFTQEPLRLLYDPGAPLLLTGAATLFLLGIVWGIFYFDLRYWLLFLPLLAALVSNTVSQDPPASQRYILAIPMVAIILAAPLGQLGAWLDRLWPQGKRVGLVVTAVLLAGIAAQDLRYYFFDVYDNYVLGGLNTLVATEVAYYLRDHEQPEQKVYFFGFPRMGYFSLSTIPYLAPRMQGEDVVERLGAPPQWELNGPTLFLFLPERLDELEQVRAAYPSGAYREFHAEPELFLFAAYEVREP